MIFLKFDFLKTCNKVKWDFLFDYMGKLIILEEFTSKTKILFIGTKAKINHKLFQKVVIERGIWCLLSSILVIEYGKIFNALVKKDR